MDKKAKLSEGFWDAIQNKITMAAKEYGGRFSEKSKGAFNSQLFATELYRGWKRYSGETGSDPTPDNIDHYLSTIIGFDDNFLDHIKSVIDGETIDTNKFEVQPSERKEPSFDEPASEPENTPELPAEPENTPVQAQAPENIKIQEPKTEVKPEEPKTEPKSSQDVSILKRIQSLELTPEQKADLAKKLRAAIEAKSKDEEF